MAVTEPSIYGVRSGDAEVRVVLTGMGAQHARRSFQIAMAEGAEACVTSGLAGGLRSKYRSGDVLAARVVRAASGGRFVKSDEALLRFAIACGAREAEAFLSAEQAVQSAKEKGRLGLCADAVEMESFTILNEAQAMHVPAVAVRVIGDPVSEELPLDFGRTLDEKGQVSARRVMMEMARNPQRAAGVARLGRQTRRAATLLAEFLDRYITVLASWRTKTRIVESVVVG